MQDGANLPEWGFTSCTQEKIQVHARIRVKGKLIEFSLYVLLSFYKLQFKEFVYLYSL